MLDRVDQTIVAVSSAPGHAAAGIVRLSGSNAIDIASRICLTECSLGELPGSRRVGGEVRIDPQRTLPAALYLFRAPHSYTKQDMVEIHTVGSPIALEMVRKACLAYGALPAEPGEFTARAFFNGAMDLAQAESVASVIQAQSDAQLRASRRMMDGALASRLSAVRNRLGELLALVEADIDFAEEPIDFINPTELGRRLGEIVSHLDKLLQKSAATQRLNQLPRILLLGPPNAGKSSLMNRLSGTPRAICAAVAGTTRDILAAPIALGRGEAILLDSAGIDESEDNIISQARALTLSEAEQVDLVCLVLDASEFAADSDLAKVQSFVHRVLALDLPSPLVVANKIDLLAAPLRPAAMERIQRLALGRVICASALTGEGIEDLCLHLRLHTGACETTAESEAFLLTARQREAMQNAAAALGRAAELASTAHETIDCADLLAFELREALDHLGAVTGTVTTEDLLTHVFANFCIGK